MIVEKQIYTVDDVWEMSQNPENENIFFELIDGELITVTRPNNTHGLLSTRISFYLTLYIINKEIGQVTVESGYYRPDYQYTLLGPDVAFTRFDRMPDLAPHPFVPVMPDLAVEVLSPSDSLAKAREKAELYLRSGTSIVWLVQPETRCIEVCRLIDSSHFQFELVGLKGTLSGEDILPGLELPVSEIFAVLRD